MSRCLDCDSAKCSRASQAEPATTMARISTSRPKPVMIRPLTLEGRDSLNHPLGDGIRIRDSFAIPVTFGPSELFAYRQSHRLGVNIVNVGWSKD